MADAFLPPRQDMNRRERLHAFTEASLIREYRLTGDVALRNRIVEANMEYALAEAARRVSWRSDARQDAEQAALLGLVEAASAWDPDQGTFLTFARHHVHGRIGAALRGAHLVEVTSEDLARWRDVERVRQCLRYVTGAEPTRDEIAEALGETFETKTAGDGGRRRVRAWTVADVAAVELMPEAAEVESLDEPVRGEDGRVKANSDGSVTTRAETLSARGSAEAVLAAPLFASLDERARKILRMRADGLTQRAISRVLGLAQQTISAAEQAACELVA